MQANVKAAGERVRQVGPVRCSGQALTALAHMAGVYAADLHDPAAVEALLLMREICYVWELAEAELEAVFGRRVLAVLADFGALAPLTLRPAHIRRAWVWQSNRSRPQLYQMDRDSAFWLVDE